MQLVLFIRSFSHFLSLVSFFSQSTTMFCLRISSSTITPDINTSRLFYRRMLSQFKWLLQSRIILRFVRFCCCCCHSSLRCRCPFVARALEFIYSQFFSMLLVGMSIFIILRFGRKFFLFGPGCGLYCERIHGSYTFFRVNFVGKRFFLPCHCSSFISS